MRSWNIQRDADGPAVVDLADPVAVGHPDVGEVLLAEVHVAVEHLDALDLDALGVDREDEHRQAAVLRHVPVGAGQAQAPVRPPRPGRPHLGTVEDPLVAVAHGGRERSGHVGTAARLGEELHPQLLAPEDRRHVPALLLLGAEVQQHRHARRHGRYLDPAREVEAGQLLVQDPLVGRSDSPWPPYSGGTVDARRDRRRRTCAAARGRAATSCSSSSSVPMLRRLTAAFGRAGPTSVRRKVRTRARKSSSGSSLMPHVRHRAPRRDPRPAGAGAPRRRAPTRCDADARRVCPTRPC